MPPKDTFHGNLLFLCVSVFVHACTCGIQRFDSGCLSITGLCFSDSASLSEPRVYCFCQAVSPVNSGILLFLPHQSWGYKHHHYNCSLHGFWGSKLRSLGRCSKHFTTQSIFSVFCLFVYVSCSPNWPQSCYVVQAVLELLIFLFQSSSEVLVLCASLFQLDLYKVTRYSAPLKALRSLKFQYTIKETKTKTLFSFC